MSATTMISRRDVLKASAGACAAAGITLLAAPVRAQAPAASAITPELVAAAKKEGKVAFYTAMDLPVAEKLAKPFPAQHRDPDGLFVTTRVWLSSLGYNTNLVKPEDAPKSFADLLDPKWAGKMVKGHPAYSGTIMTATFQ